MPSDKPWRAAVNFVRAAAIAALMTGSSLAPAMAKQTQVFDQTECPTYFVGTWQLYTPFVSSDGVNLGGKSWDIVFAKDGTFTLKIMIFAEGSPNVGESTDKGSWTAKAAKAKNACEVSLKGEKKSYMETYTVTGSDSFESGDTRGTRERQR
ncbi:hypothetical protein sos41_19590 [Alphaproteobacteria bacterium SO-S41]|nr:hypothetical protein sos41_19590 [Alphaproteobacteria bacterium SO-S41]